METKIFRLSITSENITKINEIITTMAKSIKEKIGSSIILIEEK